jgi:hypothetical protein
MKKVFNITLFVLLTNLIVAQSWNPFVSNGFVTPAPLLPWEFEGSGTLQFTIGNSGTDPIPLIPDQEMTLVITLANGLPDAMDPIDALGGTWLGYFDWVYFPMIRTFFATQNQEIPGSDQGSITIGYEVTRNTPQTVSANGFNCNIQPPPFTNGFNNTNDDAVNGYTYVIATDYGDAPLSYGSAGAEINLFRDVNNDYENFVMLGDTIDHENVYLVSAEADGDDLDNLDDEDGITAFPVFIQGTTVTIPVKLTVYGGFGFLNAWIDWNGDGDFLDAGEQIATNVFIGTTQTLNLSVNIPPGAVTGNTFARFRFGALAGPAGFADYGEVEDYMINIVAAAPEINLVKEGTYIDNNPVGIYNAGDQISYNFTVTNTGNVPLSNVTLTDPQVTVSGGPIAVLNPGVTDNSTFTAIYTLTQEDIDAGTFTNTATVTGIFHGEEITDEDIQHSQQYILLLRKILMLELLPIQQQLPVFSMERKLLMKIVMCKILIKHHR